MKTSKRLLSFFMAVVMALTACSAGFVAFARETNPKDNNPFSDELASAEKSTDALNGLLDSLLPTILDALGDETLASIGIDKSKVLNASFDDESIKSDRFYEFMNELSVFLFPKIGGKSMDAVLKEEYLSSGNTDKDAQNYAYLNDDNASIDFWTLYSVCKSNARQDGNEFQKLCYDYYNGYTNADGKEITGLKELLFARKDVLDSVSAMNESTYAAINDLAEKIGVIQNYEDMPIILDKSPDEIAAMIASYEEKNGEIKMTTDSYDYNLYITIVNEVVGSLGDSLSCKTLADLIYYTIVDLNSIQAALYNQCFVAGGFETGFAADSYTVWFETMQQLMSFSDFVEMMQIQDLPEDIQKGFYRQTLSAEYLNTILSGKTSPEETANFKEYVAGFLSITGNYSVDDTKAGIESMLFSQEQIDYLISNPYVEEYNGVAAGPALNSAVRLYNLIVYDLNNVGFSEAVKKAFLTIPPTRGSFPQFLNALAKGNKNALKQTLPSIEELIYRNACEDYAAQFSDVIDLYSVFSNKATDSYTSTLMSEYSFNASDYPIEDKYFFNLTASTIDGYISMAKNLDGLLASLGVDLSSVGISDLNSMVSSIIAGLTQTKDKDGNPITYELLLDSVDGIYSNLAKDPIGTIANAVPLLAILLDEVLLPIIFNGEGDAFNGFLDSIVFEMLPGLSKDLGNTLNELFGKYGITTLKLDLNYILPALTDYMATGSTARATKGMYDGTDTPIITNIKIADEWIAENLGNCKFVSSMDTGVAELLKTVIGVLNTSVIEYADTHKENDNADAKLGAALNGEEGPLCRGLNNIGVALPSLIDSFVKNFIKLYNVDSDWTFKARIAYSTGVISKDDTEITYATAENVTLSDLKEHIFDSGANRNPANVTSWIVQLLVNDWINAIVDLLNDVFTKEGDITNNLPIVTGILNALGGFGETSYITDVLNGLFYLTRSSKYSFTFTDQPIPCAQNNETYVGLSDNSAYYLIANVGPIIDIVMSIVNANKNAEPENGESTLAAFNSASPLAETKTTPANILGLTEKDIQDIINEASKLATKENIQKTQDILDKIDDIFSTLLENTYLNGYSVDKLDGILSGAITYLINHFGKDITDDLLKLVTDYLNIICNESIEQKWPSKRNGAPNGPVNAKKVYTNKQLSILITETYALLEEILDSQVNIKGDENDYIVNAIDGLFSPSSIGFRAGLNENILDNLTWCEVSATKYATDLGFTFSAGDKEGFYNGLFNALAPITSIIGALLSSETTGFYDNIVNPVFGSICEAAGIELYTPKDGSNAELVLATLKPIADFLNQFLAAPTNTLISLVNGLTSILADKNITKIIKSAITPLSKEIRGLHSIIAVLSPTLADSIMISDMTFAGLADKLDSIVNMLPKNNIVITLLNSLLGINLPAIDFSHNFSNGEIAFAVFTFALGIVLKSDLIRNLIPTEYKQIADMLDKISIENVLNIINRVLSVTQNPTEIYWTFEDYLAKETNSFKYPSGISASEADDAVDSLDNLVKNVFPLLKSLDVLAYDDLTGLVNGMLFKNEIITKMATGIYGKVNDLLQSKTGLNILTPQFLASYLVDSSYGNTYSDAAAALNKCSNWNQVKDLNWGFKDGSAKAEQGFINGIAAVLRPVNGILAVLLAGEKIEIGNAAIDIAGSLEVGRSDKLKEDILDDDGNKIDEKIIGEYSVVLRDGKLNIYIRNGIDNELNNRIEIDITEILSFLKDFGIYGGNGYESAIIPLLEALMCDGVKTYDQYINDYDKAKDNLLIDILNPIFGFVDKALKNPFDTITAVLPNVAYFIDNNGIAQLLNNLLSPITHNILDALVENNINVDDIFALFNLDLGEALGKLIEDNLGAKVSFSLKLSDLKSCDIQNAVIPIVNAVLKSKNINITIPDFKWSTLASHGTQTTFDSAAGGKGIRIVAKQGETLVAVLRFIADALISNANEIKDLICGIEKVAKNKTIVNILTTVFNQISGAHEDDIVKAVFYLLTQNPQNSFFDYRDFKFKDYDFSYPSTVDVDFLTTIGPMLDGLIGGLLEGGLNKVIGDLIYKDDIISSLVCGLYGAVEGVKINDNMNLAQLLAQTDIDFTTANVAKLLTDKDYGQSYASVAKVIEKAGSWSKVNKANLHWGVTDRDSFVHALCAALRPIYGVLDVLLNDGSLGLFNLIYLPGSDGYTSAIVPLMEAFGLYNVKTQYQYRQDMNKEYDAILLDILNPLLDKVEDILNAPIQMLCDILPNLSLFFANDGLLQLIDNLLLPITALLDSLKPIVDVNDLLKAVGLDIEKELAKIGLAVKGFEFDIYNLSATLKPLIGADSIVSLLNKVLGLIKIGGSPLGIELMPIDWFQLASHGELITDEASQAATFGSRMYVKADPSEVLIAVLRYLINTINYGDNFNTISDLIGGLLGNASASVSDMISKVLGMLTGDTDEVISSLCELLKTLA